MDTRTPVRREHEIIRGYATVADVCALLMRPVTNSEKEFLPALLERALRMIDRTASQYGIEFKDLDAGAVKDVQADMVARLVRNPEGLRSENDGQYAYQIDTRSASGRLELTDSDLASLGLFAPSFGVLQPNYGGSLN